LTFGGLARHARPSFAVTARRMQVLTPPANWRTVER
jgi:hypothetical protein